MMKVMKKVIMKEMMKVTSSCAFSSFLGSPPFSKVLRLSRRAFTTSVGDLEDFPKSGNIVTGMFELLVTPYAIIWKRCSHEVKFFFPCGILIEVCSSFCLHLLFFCFETWRHHRMFLPIFNRGEPIQLFDTGIIRQIDNKTISTE